jgi:hypothetical protein
LTSSITALPESAVVPSDDPFETRFQGFNELYEAKRPEPGSLPARRDFDISDLRPWMGYLCVYDIIPGPPLRLWTRLKGSAVGGRDASDSTADYLDSHVPAELYEFVMAPYLAAIEKAAPVRQERRETTPAGMPTLAVKTVYPLANDGLTADKFLMLYYADYPDHETFDPDLLFV